MKRAIMLFLVLLMVLFAFSLSGSSWGVSISIVPAFQSRAGPINVQESFTQLNMDRAFSTSDIQAMDVAKNNGLLDSSEYVLTNILLGLEDLQPFASTTVLVLLEQSMGSRHLTDRATNMFSDYYWLKESAVNHGIWTTFWIPISTAELTGNPVLLNGVRSFGREVLLIRK